MNNCELYLAYVYTVRFILISLRNLLYNSPKLTNTYKQTSTVIYNRLSVITDRNKSASSSYFESCLLLVNSPCFHISMLFTGGSPFYALTLCLSSEIKLAKRSVSSCTFFVCSCWNRNLDETKFQCIPKYSNMMNYMLSIITAFNYNNPPYMYCNFL